MILDRNAVLARLKADPVRFLSLLRLLAEEETTVYGRTPDPPVTEMIFAAGEENRRELWVFSPDEALFREAVSDVLPGTLVRFYGNAGLLCPKVPLRATDRRVLDTFGVFGTPVRHVHAPNLPDVTTAIWREPLPPFPPGVDWERLAIRLRTKPPGDRVRFALRGGKTVGYLWDTESVGNFREIGNVFVDPAARRQGIGALLVHGFIADARLMGSVPYYGCALSEESRRLAIRCGFAEVLPPPVLYEIE